MAFHPGIAANATTATQPNALCSAGVSAKDIGTNRPCARNLIRGTDMNYAISTTLDKPFDKVVEQVRAALADEGFGVITEIDMKATLHKKIGATIDNQVILGACNPDFAHKAIQAEPSIGVLLPCNVVVRSDADKVTVEMINLQTMVDLTANPEMAALAQEISENLERAIQTLR